MDKVINWFLIIIILVFDPLAIALIVAANFAFSQISPKKLEEIPTVENLPLEESTPEPILTPTPEIQQMQGMLKRSDISGWRKNRIREQLPPEDNVKEY
jgi:hypothetical protein